jgi:hypothetical protein
MGLLDSIGALLQGATSGGIAARTGYLEGQTEEKDRRRQEARQSMLDKMAADLHASQMREYNARADMYDRSKTGDDVVYKTDVDGNIIALPKSFPKSPGIGTQSAQSPLSSMKQDLGMNDIPSFDPTPTTKGIDRALQGGDIADVPTASGGGVLASMRQDVAGGSPAQGPSIGRPTGVRTRVPSEPTVAVLGDDGKPTLVKRSDAAGRTPYRPTGNTPHTIVTDQGIMQYDPATDSWKPTGYTRTPASKAGGAGSLADTRSEKYFSTVAQSAIKAADEQLPADIPDADRPHAREQLAIQLILGNPKTADIFTKGMTSRHIQAANQQTLDAQTKAAQAGARTNYTINKDVFPATPPARGTPPAGAGASAPPGSTGDIDLGAKPAPKQKASSVPPPQTQDEYDHLIQAGMTDAQIVARYGAPAAGIRRKR